MSKDGFVKPCIYSSIKIARLRNNKFPNELERKLQYYWHINKDKIQKCKDCELRYICFDCREIPLRETGDLYSPSPYCKYDPYKGEWKD